MWRFDGNNVNDYQTCCYHSRCIANASWYGTVNRWMNCKTEDGSLWLTSSRYSRYCPILNCCFSYRIMAQIRKYTAFYVVFYIIFVFYLSRYKYRSGRQGFCKFLLQQRTVCVFYFTIMLLNNYVICFANIMSILRTSLRVQFMANLLLLINDLRPH